MNNTIQTSSKSAFSDIRGNSEIQEPISASERGDFSTTETIENESQRKCSTGFVILKVYSGENIKLPLDYTKNEHTSKKIAPKETHREQSTQIPDKSSALTPDKTRLSIYLKAEFAGLTQVIVPQNDTFDSPLFNVILRFKVGCWCTDLKIHVWAKLSKNLISKTDLEDEKEDSDHIHILIGTCHTLLDSELSASSRLMNHEWVNIINKDNRLSLGLLQMTVDYKHVPPAGGVNINDFEVLKLIGKGNFGNVLQVKKKDTGKIYAMKVIKKFDSSAEKKMRFALLERTVLSKVNSHFMVFLEFAFQTAEQLYLVMPFVSGGELFHHLKKRGTFSLNRSKFYISEIALGLESLHNMNIVYRDLKPENVLLDSQGHIVLCDFGLCKVDLEENSTTNTFCGTSEYLAPELLLNRGYTRLVDYWSMGILLYEMLFGITPFADDNLQVMLKKIVYRQVTFPALIDKTTKSLITLLLKKKQNERLGSNGMDEVKNHKFFKGIDWSKMANKIYIPSWKPNVSNQSDTRNFDSFSSDDEMGDDSKDGLPSAEIQKMFCDWNFSGRQEDQ